MTTVAPRPQHPRFLPAAARGVTTSIELTDTVHPRLLVTDTFANLDGFRTVIGNPTLESGMLAGEAVLVHRNECLTDSMAVTGVIGQHNTGKTRMVVCGDTNFDLFYGLEIETGLVNNKFHLLRGSAANTLLDGGIISDIRKYETTDQTCAVDDEITLWYDEEPSVLRAFKNDAQVCSMPVPRGEIPHGEGFRNHGIAQGVDIFLGFVNAGVKFTSYAAEDR